MPRIKITEVDNTKPGGQSYGSDIVYIPGFVNSSAVSTPSDILEYNKPTLFTTISSFETKCGTYPARFDTTQYYNNEYFPSKAIPSNGIMFEKDSFDPAYIMAKEILASGLPVVYERIDDRIGSDTVGNDTYAVQYANGVVCFDVLKEYKDQQILFIPEQASGEIDDDTTYIVLNNDITTESGLTKTEGSNKYTAINGTTLKGLAADSTKASIIGIKQETISDTTKYVFTATTIMCNLPNIYSTTEIQLESGTSICTQITKNLLKENYNAQGAVTSYEKRESIYQLHDEPLTWNGNTFYYFTRTQESVNEINTPTTSGVKGFVGGAVGNPMYYLSPNDISVNRFYNEITKIFAIQNNSYILDKGNLSFKYLTTGGYPSFEYDKGTLVQNMLQVCESRGDCVALIDHTNNPERTLNINSANSLYRSVQTSTSLGSSFTEYGSMFTPWIVYNRITTDSGMVSTDLTKQITLPASFAYLTCLADSIKTNANWLAVAGVTRGLVLNIADGGVTQEISNGLADNMQPRGLNEGDGSTGISINAITNIQPYGYTIWGNRTLVNNTEGLVATSFLNIRNLVSDVKKLCYRVARKLTFEQNNDVLWVNFKSGITPLLDNMLTGYGISGYKFVRDTENEHAKEKATLCAKIILFPTYAVEDFYISIILEDDEVTVQ